MNEYTNLKKELDEKIHRIFKDNQGYFDYILQTKKNFLHRFLETSTDKNIQIENLDSKTLSGTSYECNMGEAFKSADIEIKEGIKALAKSVAKEKNPRILYSLKTVLDEFKGDSGKITIIAEVNWNFPEFVEDKGNYKRKKVVFEFQDPNVFRKQLALKYEEACELFI